MKLDKKILSIAIKTISVLLIPYVFMIDSHTTGGLSMDTSYLISGLIGHWVSAGSSYTWPTTITFWQGNQLLYSILFMLPMILFAYFFDEREIDRRSVVAGIIATLVPFFALFVSTPFIPAGITPILFYLVLPNVITLAMFVFVFWWFLRKTWPISVKDVDVETESGKVRRILREWIPRDVASIIWLCLVVFPTYIAMYVLFGVESETHYTIQISGGLYYVFYDYMQFTGSGYYPTRFLSFGFETAASPTILTLGQ